MIKTIAHNIFAVRMKIANMPRPKKYMAVFVIGFLLGCVAITLGRPMP